MLTEGMKSSEFIFNGEFSFEDRAGRVFEYQRKQNALYRRFTDALSITEIRHLSEIPLLPIQAFRDTEVYTSAEKPHLYFQSSGTSGMQRSRHFIADPALYKQSIRRGFDLFYGSDAWVILAYTPGYNENPNSSLIYMLKLLIEEDESGLSSFLPLQKPLDGQLLGNIQTRGRRLMLFGAAFGLIDLAEKYPTALPPGSIIMETGGMKTHRREMTRREMHSRLSDAFSVPPDAVHSEYGMTELLSQAWSRGDDWFQTPHWMQVSIRKPDNPMKEAENGEEGLIGIIDLANIFSCPFLLTGDKGKKREDGAFQVLGRWQPENLRGCNFLIDKD